MHYKLNKIWLVKKKNTICILISKMKKSEKLLKIDMVLPIVGKNKAEL